MKFLKYLFGLIIVGCVATAQAAPGPYFGYVQQGGKTVSTSGFQSITNVQRSFPGATVKVCLASTGCSASGGTVATLFSDSIGTPKGNPFAAGNDGSFIFWSNTTTFDIVFYGKGITTSCGGASQLPCISAFTWASQSFSGFAPSTTLPFVVAPAPSGGDDSSAIQSLINTNNAIDIDVRLQGGLYLLNTELGPVAGHPLRLSGASHNYLGAGGTVLKAIGSIRSCIAVTQPYSQVSDIKVDANQLATYGFFFNSSSLGHYSNLYATNAKLDGFYLEVDTGAKFNDTSLFEQLWGVSNGTVYTTAGISGQYTTRKSVIAGTATVVTANATITIVGGPDLTTFPFRTGDYIRTGSGTKSAASTFAGQIQSITATTIVLGAAPPNLPIAAQAGAGLDFAISSGDGYHEIVSANNNINTIIGGLMRANSGAGFSFHGNNGPTVIGTQCDGNVFYSYAVGNANNTNLMYGVSFVRPYSEQDGIHADFFLGNVNGISIISATGISIAGAGANGTASVTHGQIFSNEAVDTVESIAIGTDQNWLFEIQNVAGTIKHRTVASHYGGFIPLAATKMVGNSVLLTTTPTLDATHNFATGAGVFSVGGALVVLINTTAAQNSAPYGTLTVEYDDTGTRHGVIMEVQSAANVNGTTRNWLAFYLTDSTGALIDWSAANIAAGKTIGVRFNGKLR